MTLSIELLFLYISAFLSPTCIATKAGRRKEWGKNVERKRGRTEKNGGKKRKGTISGGSVMRTESDIKGL